MHAIEADILQATRRWEDDLKIALIEILGEERAIAVMRAYAHAFPVAYRDDVTPRLASPALRSDYFKTAVEFIRGSNALVEALYRIDRDGGFDVFRPVAPEAKSFTSDRLAAGASLLRDLWWSRH